MKKHLSSVGVVRRVFIATILAGTALIAAASPATSKIYTMKVACNSINDVQSEWTKLFAARIEKRSHGRIKATVYPGGQLGTTPRIIEGVQFGAIEAYVVPAENFVGVDKRFAVVGAPGWFDNIAQAKRAILDPRFRDQFLKLGEKKGLVGVSLFVYGPDSYATREPIRSPDDFKGKKIRVAASKLQSLPLQRLGASADPIPLSEVLPAFQQGTVDGVRLSINLFNNYKYYDVAKYVTDTNEAVLVSVGVVSRIWFDKLPKDLQKIVLEEGANLDREMSDYSTGQFKDAEAQWQKHGGTIIHFSAPDQARFMKVGRAAAKDVFAQEPGTQRLYGLLRQVAKANE